MAEVNREEGSIRVGGTIDITSPNVIVVSQYDGAVGWVIHPPPDGGLGGIVCTGPGFDDLPSPAAGITCSHLPLPITGPVRTGMGEEIIDGHVQAVDAGRSFEGIVRHQGSQSGFGTLIVDQKDDLGLKGTIIDGGTTRWIGRFQSPGGSR